MNFANLTFTDYSNPEKPKILNLPMSWLEKDGDISKAIESVLTVVANTFAKIGKGESFDKDDVEDGVQAIKGAGLEVTNIVKSMSSVAELIEKDVSRSDLEKMTFTVLTSIPKAVVAVKKYLAKEGNEVDLNTSTFLATLPTLLSQTAKAMDGLETWDDSKLTLLESSVPRLMNLMPTAIVQAIATMSGVADDPFTSFKLLTDSTTTISDAVEKIADAEEPLEKVASSFQSIAESMTEMSDSIDGLDSMKLEKLNTMFNEIKYIAHPEDGLPVQDIPGQIATGIDKGLSIALDKADKVADKLDKVQTQVDDAQVKAASGGGSEELVLLLTTRLDRLEKVMTKVYSALAAGIAVDISNTDDFTINK